MFVRFIFGTLNQDMKQSKVLDLEMRFQVVLGEETIAVIINIGGKTNVS